MTNINILQIKLEKVVGTDFQISILYNLLIQRKFNISNSIYPSLISHSKFVKRHPYRIWYLILIDNFYIGSVYITKTNSIGIFLLKNYCIFSQVLDLILKKHKPLKEIKSIRPSYFFINISPKDRKLEHQLIKYRAQKIQHTYSIL